MAMTVRLPAELDAQLEALAARTHTSKHALLLQGAQYVVERAARCGLVDDAVDFVLSHDADLLRRLEDA
ncbi:ribbon-helix-helix protein, CopG family [Microbacterium sp.]|uniref:CopG family ribbon-helix-helix protein n=1 Tax=Microbacterium sp. TaxID=51671 RepID=UPI0032217966